LPLRNVSGGSSGADDWAIRRHRRPLEGPRSPPNRPEKADLDPSAHAPGLQFRFVARSIECGLDDASAASPRWDGAEGIGPPRSRPPADPSRHKYNTVWQARKTSGRRLSRHRRRSQNLHPGGPLATPDPDATKDVRPAGSAILTKFAIDGFFREKGRPAR